MIPNPAALQPIPATAPAPTQKPRVGDGPRNIARFTVITRANKNQAKYLGHRTPTQFLFRKPIERDPSAAENGREYHIPPIAKATKAAARIASHHEPVIIAGIAYCPFGHAIGPNANR
jgi:hypothetical protein